MEGAMDITENIKEEESMITGVEGNLSFFLIEDLPRVKHYVINVIPTEEFWKNWPIISGKGLTNNNFDGIIFNNVKDYNSGVISVSIDLSKSQNNTDVYVPLNGLLSGVYIIFLIDKHHTLRYKLKPDCYKDLESDLSAQLAGIMADSMKYCSIVISPDFQFLLQQVCTLALDKGKDDCAFLDIFKNCYNNNIKVAVEEKDFAVLYHHSFLEAKHLVEEIEKKKTDDRFVSMLNSTYSLTNIKEIVQQFSVNGDVNDCIASIIDSLSQFKSDIKTIKTREELYMNVIRTNDIIIIKLAQLQHTLALNNQDVLYNCIHKCLSSEDLYIDLNTILSVLLIVKEGAPHSTKVLMINESSIITQELKNKINALQKSIQHNEEMKILKGDAYKFCHSKNIEDQCVFWFKKLAKSDQKFRFAATRKTSSENLSENVKIQLYFEEHYSEYLIQYPKSLTRNHISLSKVIDSFANFKFTDHKTVRDSVVEFLQNAWNVKYWSLNKALEEYENKINEVIYFHHALASDTADIPHLLPSWPIVTGINKPGVMLDENTYEIVIEQMIKPLPSILEYHYLPFIVSELQNCHFVVPSKGTVPNTLIQLWNTKLYHEYNTLKSKYETCYKANERKLSTIISWVDSTKQPTFAYFYHELKQIASKGNKLFVDDDFKAFVQNVLLVQRSDIFDDLAQLVSIHNQKTYNFVRQMADDVYLKKLNISSQEVFKIVFYNLLQQVYLKLKSSKIFEGIFDSLNKDFVKLVADFDNYYYPVNIGGDINVKIVEKKTNIEVSQINGEVFKSQTENTGISLSAIYRYDPKLFISGLLKWISQKKGEWMFSRSLPIEDFRSQFPDDIMFHDINALPTTHTLGLFLTTTFMLFSNSNIINFIKASNLSHQEIDSHINQLSKTLYTYIKPYFLIKECVQAPDHFNKYVVPQKDSLNIYISCIYKQNAPSNNLNFPFDGNYKSLFNLFITEMVKKNIQIDINFLLHNDENKILAQYVHELQSLNSTCISKLIENIVFNKNHAFAYIRDNYLVHCNEEMKLSVSQNIVNNLPLYQCNFIITDPYEVYPERGTNKLNPFNNSGILASISQETYNEDYYLTDAMKMVSLCGTDTTYNVTEGEQQFVKEKQDLIDVVQNEALKVDQYDNIIPEISVSSEDEILSNESDEDLTQFYFDQLPSFIDDGQLSESDLNENEGDLSVEATYNLNPLSINNTISHVPCVVSNTNPPKNGQSINTKSEYAPIIVHNRDRDLIKHLAAILHFLHK